MAVSFTQWIEASFGNRTMRPSQARAAGLSEIEPEEAGLRRFIKKPVDPTDADLEDATPSTPSWGRRRSPMNIPDANTASSVDSQHREQQQTLISQFNKVASSLSTDQLTKLVTMATQMSMSGRYPGGPLKSMHSPAPEPNYEKY